MRTIKAANSEMSRKKLLLLAYLFPPAAGIGGYRWAQMCKYLARLGLEIHVATVPWRKTSQATLLEEVQHPNIHIHRIPAGYPHNLAVRDFGNRLLNGVRNKVFIHVIDHFYPLDHAQHWDRHLLPFCQKIIEERGITSIVATGSPFMVNVHAATLKKAIPEVALIQDMRDPWYNNKVAMYSEKLRKQILPLERFALQTADAVVTVTDGCKKTLEETAGKTPVHVISNGYDTEKFISNGCGNGKKDRIFFVHLGSIYGNREVCADTFLDFLRTFPQGQALFAGSLPRWLLEKYTDLIDAGQFQFVGTVSHQKCIKFLSAADFALHFNAKNTPEAASTKIYEYAAAGCPVLSFNFGSEPERLIREHHLGISINMESPGAEYSAIAKNILAFDRTNFTPYDIQKYSYAELAKKYLKLIESISY